MMHIALASTWRNHIKRATQPRLIQISMLVISRGARAISIRSPWTSQAQHCAVHTSTQRPCTGTNDDSLDFNSMNADLPTALCGVADHSEGARARTGPDGDKGTTL